MAAAVEFDIFVSYATADASVVGPLVERLKADGFTVWFDQEGMVGGPSVLSQLADAIANSAHTIACLSDSYLQRPFTTFELNSSTHRDPASQLARTIPVKLKPLSVALPNFIQHLTICDLTDPSTADRVYAQIVRSIRRTAPRAQPGVDEQTAALACDAPYQHLAEPEVTLFLIRQAAGAMAQFLHRREIGEPATGLNTADVLRALIVSGRIPTKVAGWLTYLREFGEAVVGGRADELAVTAKSIEPALDTLRDLAAWAFPGRPRDDKLHRLVAELPRIGDSGEVQLPGNSLRLRVPERGRGGLGPVFAARDTAGGEEVTVVLTDRPESFADDVSRYAGVPGLEVVGPTGVGTLAAADGNRCAYVVYPALRDIPVAELAASHGGRLPAGPVYEIGLGLAVALRRLHDLRPPLAHGEVAAGDVLVSRFGSVRLRTPGGDPAEPEADVRAVPALLRTLLAGPDQAGVERDGVEKTLQLLEGCTTTAQLRRVLDEQRRLLPAEPSLRSLLTGVTPAPGPAPDGPDLIETYPARARRVWPLGEGRVLIWEADTETLAVLDGPRPLWRDDVTLPIRVAVAGPGGQVAIGGWDGAVRWFADGGLVASAKLDGPVGDLRLTPRGLVAGSWKHALTRLTRDGGRHDLLDVDGGVHRIAIAGGGDRFAVADLGGRLAVYRDDVRVRDWQRFPAIADLAYAGSSLVMLGGDGLTVLGVDDRPGPVEPKPGALRLLPGATAGTCLLLVAADPARVTAAPLEAWSIDQDDRHILHTTFPAGCRIGSACARPGRFTLELPGGGHTYWRDDTERRVWPDALAATLSHDGGQLAVARPDRVELYVDAE